MFVKQETLIGFKMPEDMDKMERFKRDNDASGWNQEFDSTHIYYSKKDIWIVDKEEE